MAVTAVSLDDVRAASGLQPEDAAQVERLTRHERLETTREQELADQVVELGNVARDAGAKTQARCPCASSPSRSVSTAVVTPPRNGR